MRFSRLFAFAATAVAVAAGSLVAYSLSKRSPQAATAAATANPAKPPRIPMWFERNTDEYPAQVLYASRSLDQTVFLTAQDMVITSRDGAALHIGWKNGKPARATRGEAPLRARVDYFRGRNQNNWRAGDATRYSKVRYEQVYNGVDLVFHPQGSQLEHDFVVAPGADPKQIALTFTGATSMRLDRDGSLALRVGASDIRQSKPVAYQEIDGRRVEVAANFRVTGDNEAAFELGAYDTTRELVIDPVLQYSSYIGGTSLSSPTTVVAEPGTGILWITGTTTSTDFPITGDPIRDTGFGNRDIFIAKVDPTKSGPDSLVYAAFVGGTGNDEGRSMVLDRDGNAVIAGMTASADFPIVGSYDTEILGGQDAVVLKIDPRRGGKDALVYTTFLGGDGQDWANAVAVDSLNKIVVAGYTVSENFPVTANAIQRNRQAGYELFISKIDPDTGTSGLQYSTYYGGSGTDIARAVAVDAQGLIYVAGNTSSANFPIGDRAYQPTYQNAGDMFLIRVDPGKSGIDGISYGTYIGGSGIDSAESMTLAADGTVYLAGYTTSNELPTAGNAPQTQNAGGADVYVARLDLKTSTLVFATYLGGKSTDIAYGMNVDSTGRIHVTGYTYSSDFNVTRNALQPKSLGIPDAFMASINPSLPAAEALLYSSYVTSAGLDYGSSITANSSCLVSAVGSTTGRKFTVTDSAYQSGPSGFPDVFVTSVNICQ